MANEPIKGDGWAVASIDDLGEGPGFRKVRQALDVTEFGVNGVVLPPGYTSRRHYHDRQQELYMVLRGDIEFDAPTVRALRNTSETDEAVYLCVGGQGGYVGRDGQVP